MKQRHLWKPLGRAIVLAAMAGLIASGAAAQASKSDDTVRSQSLKPIETPKKDEEPSPANIDGSLVILQGLDKETARIQTFGGKVGSVVTFRTLEIAIRRCQKTPPQLKPEKAAFLQIFDVDPETKKKKMVFSGWMFASSPALSAMDHPTYDIWVKDCK